MENIFGKYKKNEETDWLSVSDLMAGLMVVFLFVSIIFIKDIKLDNIRLEANKVELEDTKDELEKRNTELKHAQEILRNQKHRIEEIVVAWKKAEEELYNDLLLEFENDLRTWNAELERETLIIRFKAPEVLFEKGKDTIKPKFETILADFFPRYIRVLENYKESIEEIRIEGHTSSEYALSESSEDAYYKNMELSQSRTREVLKFSLSTDIQEGVTWIRPLLTANGLSSSKLILNDDKTENISASRRVEFRVKTKARSEIVKILEEVK